MCKLPIEMTNEELRVLEQIDNIILHLLKYRKKTGLTQEEVAQRAGVSRSTISRIESFAFQPDLKTLISICNVYGVSLSLVADVDNK